MKNRSKTTRWLLVGMLIVVVLAFGVYVGAQALVPGASPLVIENTFTKSMQSQNYENAFSTFDVQQFLIEGRHVTKTQFIQEAKAMDARDGKITQIGGDKASSDLGKNERAITWTFSRKQASYPVRVTMKIINDNFITQMLGNYQYKIVSISRL